MIVKFNVVGYIDRRGPRELEAARVIEQRRADLAIENEYRRRVLGNWKERARLLGVPRAWLSPSEKPAMLQHQAE